MNKKIEAIRQVVADYMQSEGCSCCRDEDAHRDHTKALALLLGVPMYEDGSGYNFSMFRTDRQPTTRAADATKPCDMFQLACDGKCYICGFDEESHR